MENLTPLKLINVPFKDNRGSFFLNKGGSFNIM